MNIRKIPRGRPYIPLLPLIKASVKIPFASLNDGKKKQVAENGIAQFFGISHVKLLSTCRMAFFLALKSLNLKPGDEVLLSPVTIPDIVNAIHIAGLTPVFIDINPQTHFINYEDLSRKVSDKSKVLLITYLSGIVPDIKQVLDFAQLHDLIVVEDISHNYNSYYENRLLGTFGEIAVGSTCISKSLSSLGGGFLMTDNEQLSLRIAESSNELFNAPARTFILSQIVANLATLISTDSFIFSIFTFNLFRLIRRYDPKTWEYLETFNRNQSEDAPLYDNPAILRNKLPSEAYFWFSDLQAEILLKVLKRIDCQDNKRINLFNVFYEHLEPRVRKNLVQEYAGEHRSVYWHIPYRSDNKFALKNFLFNNGIDAIGFIMKNCAHEKAFERYYTYCPGAEEILNETLLIPIHSSFSEKDMIYMAKTLNNYV